MLTAAETTAPALGPCHCGLHCDCGLRVPPQALPSDVKSSGPLTATDRSAIRSTIRRCLATSGPEVKARQLALCGTPAPGSGLIAVGSNGILGGQMVACESLIRCAYCSAKQWEQHQHRLSWQLDRWLTEHDGWLAMSSLTVPHGRNDDLAPLLAQLNAGMSAVATDQRVRGAKARAGVRVGWSILHVTRSIRHGWHPHFHSLWFGQGDQDLVSELGERISMAWDFGTESYRSPNGKWGFDAHGSRTEPLEVPRHALDYISPEDPWHPVNNCNDSDHPGCPFCDPANIDLGRADDDRGFDDDPFWERDHNDDSPFFRQAGYGIWSTLGRMAVRDRHPQDKMATAMLMEYVNATAGFQPVRGTGWLNRLVGVPPSEPKVPTPMRLGESRAWVDPLLWNWAERRGRAPRSITGSDPQVLAAALSDAAGVDVIVRTAPDGQPMLVPTKGARPMDEPTTAGTPNDIEIGLITVDDNGKITGHPNGAAEAPAETPMSLEEAKARRLELRLAKFADTMLSQGLRALDSGTDDNAGEAAAEMHDLVTKNPSLWRAWHAKLLKAYENGQAFDGTASDWLVELEQIQDKAIKRAEKAARKAAESAES